MTNHKSGGLILHPLNCNTQSAEKVHFTFCQTRKRLILRVLLTLPTLLHAGTHRVAQRTMRASCQRSLRSLWRCAKPHCDSCHIGPAFLRGKFALAKSSSPRACSPEVTIWYTDNLEILISHSGLVQCERHPKNSMPESMIHSAAG